MGVGRRIGAIRRVGKTRQWYSRHGWMMGWRQMRPGGMRGGSPLRVFAIIGPTEGVVKDVLADLIPFCIIANDVFIIITLPDRYG
jgi:hypothetical protein